ncbi:GNAT family N-acetyltransferase [Mesorhizobium sp. 1B3]|uniref:GNAT family N-acetyltransferase n=1 Tax=Mesorhizobium sp. 1B3 TaxID=3243599 RepID=UPI003D97B53F
MSGLTLRLAEQRDRGAIRDVEQRAFGRADEADLVEELVAAGDVVLELVAERHGEIVGHVLFSRLRVEKDGAALTGVALAPLAVLPEEQGTGVGRALVEEAHRRLQAAGETLSVVLGEPSYYGRFGYEHQRAKDFESDYQCDALQAVAWGDAPLLGKLVYPAPFSGL